MNYAKRALRKLDEWTDIFRATKTSYGTVKEIGIPEPFFFEPKRVKYYDIYVIEADDGYLYWDFMPEKKEDVRLGQRVRMTIRYPSKNRSSEVPRRAFSSLLNG